MEPVDSPATAGIDSPANVDVSRSRSSNSEPYPYAHHYTDHFLTNIEFCGGSQSAATSLPKFRAEPKDNAGQVFDTSPQSATHTSQGVWSAYIPPSAMCMDRLREELSCAICLEICFEPCTTPCGHSFCKKCLTSAADRCGNRCPKCRQQLLISNQRGTAVSTVLWNTIQLLFPKEVEARKAAGELSRAEPEHLQRRGVDSRTWRESSSEDSDEDMQNDMALILNSLFPES